MSRARRAVAYVVIGVALLGIVSAVGDRPTVPYAFAALTLAFILAVCWLLNRWVHR